MIIMVECICLINQSILYILRIWQVKKTIVSIEIDGTDVLDGNAIIVDAFSSTTIERSIKNNNLLSGRTFKFIEKTDKISNHRGDKVEDRLINIVYQFEVDKVMFREPAVNLYNSSLSSRRIGQHGVPCNNMISSVMDTATFSSSVTSTCFDNLFDDEQEASSGITVDGSKSNQPFREGTTRPLEAHKSSIVMQLFGKDRYGRYIGSLPNKNAKMKCPTCGTKNKVKNNFCSECGTGIL